MESTGDPTSTHEETPTYEPPEIRTFSQADILSAVNKGSKFPARGFAG
jgi:hypothetical protein